MCTLTCNLPFAIRFTKAPDLVLEYGPQSGEVPLEVPYSLLNSSSTPGTAILTLGRMSAAIRTPLRGPFGLALTVQLLMCAEAANSPSGKFLVLPAKQRIMLT